MKKIDIYTWTYCPFCIRAKRLFDKLGVSYEEHVIDHDREALAQLKEKTGVGSVPQIFVDGDFVGGCDDAYQIYRDGRFDEIFRG